MSILKRDITPMTEETRLALLEQSIDHINQSLERIDKRFDSIDKRFEKVDQKFLLIDQKFERLQETLHSQFRWTMGVMISLFSGLYATFIGGILAKMFGLI
jgi:septation ring formation regulator EzrA